MRRGIWAIAAATALAVPLIAGPVAAAAPARAASAVALQQGSAPGATPIVIREAAAGHVAAAPHAATAPVNVGTKQIDDLAGVGADTSAARDALDELRAKSNVGLFVVFIDSFDGASPSEWAKSAYQQSSLGDRDMLWAVAPSELRQGYYISNFPVDQATVDSVLAGPLANAKSNGDWSAAVVAAAQGLQNAISGSGNAGSGNAGPAGTTSPGSASHGSLAWLWLVLVIAIGVVGFLWFRAAQRKKAADAEAKKNAGPPPEPYEQLSARSVNALIETDNAVQAADNELQLAEAEFGTEATAEFRAAHDDAKAKLTKAFQLRQEIDDEIPESNDIRRGWMTQILDLCGAAMSALSAQTEKFNTLRNLAARLPQVLAALPGSIDAAASRLPQAAATLQRLSGAYSPAALATVAQNPDQANERLQYARTALAEAQKPATEQGAAVLAARAAEEAVAQATTMLDAIDRIDTDLAAAVTKMTAERDAVTRELSDVSAALKKASAGGDQDDILHRLAAIQATVNQSTSADAARDPITTLKALSDADLALDDILADTRTAQQREARARAALDNELTTASSTISAVDDFIATRRGAVASTARTRLAEAQRHLAAARSLAETDAKQALAEAQQATALARQAYQEAHNDMNNFYGGGGYGRRSSMGGVAGGLLGGIVIGSLLGGGGRGWGGGWGGGGFGGGGFGGGGFGGGGFTGGGGGGFGGGGFTGGGGGSF